MEASFRFFENRACRYFPCHEGLEECNCLFCYCPLYARVPCPGSPSFKEKDGRLVKVCTACGFPHRPENYGRIMRLLRAGQGAPAPAGYRHGGELSVADGVRLDFSVNVNPLGVPGGVRRVLAGLLDPPAEEATSGAGGALARYPDGGCARLRSAIALRRGVPADMVLCGNGASELIALLAAALEPRTALLPAPTFSGYERALRARGVDVRRHPLRREAQFALQEDILGTLRAPVAAPDVLFLCNPNNPVGNCVSRPLLEEIADTCEERGIFLIVDECFLGFLPDCGERTLARLVPGRSHLIVLDAFTKLYAIPSLRLGYVLCSNAALLRKMASLQPEWSVSLPAQEAGAAALAERDYVARTQALVEEERGRLSRGLSRLGCTVYDGEANFVFFSAEREGRDGELAARLLRRGIAVRSCGSFCGLGGHDYRVAVRLHEENERLIAAMEEAYGE